MRFQRAALREMPLADIVRISDDLATTNFGGKNLKEIKENSVFNSPERLERSANDIPLGETAEIPSVRLRAGCRYNQQDPGYKFPFGTSGMFPLARPVSQSRQR